MSVHVTPEGEIHGGPAAVCTIIACHPAPRPTLLDVLAHVPADEWIGEADVLAAAERLSLRPASGTIGRIRDLRRLGYVIVKDQMWTRTPKGSEAVREHQLRQRPQPDPQESP